MLLFIILVVIAALAWIIFKPDWLPTPPDNNVTKVVNHEAEQLQRQSTGWAQRASRLWQKNTSLGALLKTWLAQDSLVQKVALAAQPLPAFAGLQTWATNLSEAEAEQIAGELHPFCAARGIKLRWLFEENLGADLRAMMTHLVLFYCLAACERKNAQHLAALQNWEEAPQTKENRAFGGQLFVTLANAGIIEIPASILLAPEKDRQRHMVEAIQSAIKKDRGAVESCAADVFHNLENSAQKDDPSQEEIDGAVDRPQTA